MQKFIIELLPKLLMFLAFLVSSQCKKCNKTGKMNVKYNVVPVNGDPIRSSKKALATN